MRSSRRRPFLDPPFLGTPHLRGGLLSALLLCASTTAVAQPTAPDAKANAALSTPRDVSDLIRPIIEKHKIPGMAVAVVKGDETVMTGAAGVRAAGHDEAITIDDLFHLGSCTKAMTATLCAMLVEEGKLSWDTTLADAFPDTFKPGNDHPVPDPAWKAVTLRQLLNNRGGVPGDLSADGLWGRLWAHNGTPVEARDVLLRGVLSHPPAHAPGTQYEYANAGFAIAGHMAETVTGTAWEDLIQERLFRPLGITSAGYGAPGSAKEVDQPRGHKDGKPVKPGRNADNPPAISPAGRVYMTVPDWARFIALHLQGDKENPRRECRLLKPESFDMLHAVPNGDDGKPVEPPYAMGWLAPRRPWGDGKVLTHNGSNTMWFCVTWIAPKKNFAVVVACNTAGSGADTGCDEAASALIGAMLAESKGP